LLAKRPTSGRLRTSRLPGLRNMRWLPVKGFPNYLVFYRPILRGIEVVRVLHGARDIAAQFKEPAV
jgi:toxin ParE1/3/4